MGINANYIKSGGIPLARNRDFTLRSKVVQAVNFRK